MRNPTWQQVATDEELRGAIVTAALAYTNAHAQLADLDPAIDRGPFQALEYEAHRSLAVLRALAAILIDRAAEEGRR